MGCFYSRNNPELSLLCLLCPSPSLHNTELSNATLNTNRGDAQVKARSLALARMECGQYGKDRLQRRKGFDLMWDMFQKPCADTVNVKFGQTMFFQHQPGLNSPCCHCLLVEVLWRWLLKCLVNAICHCCPKHCSLKLSWSVNYILIWIFIH